MLHPIGRRPSGVYWRRRLLALSIVVLVLVTAYVAFFRGGRNKAAAAKSPSTSSGGASRTPLLSSSPTPTSASSAAAVPAGCTSAQLAITSKTDAVTYPVGGKPELSLVVVNKGSAPCVADLSDGQIELRVFSGGARVWDSHDCAAPSGSSPQTLPVGAPVTRAVAWSGLTSQPGCTGQRQRVPAGSYTLVAALAGQQAAPAVFSFAAA